MSIVATCQCGKSFQAKPELAGRRVKCPACGQPFTVPNPQQQVPAADPLGLGGGDPLAANPATPFGGAGQPPDSQDWTVENQADWTTVQQPAFRQPQMVTVQPGMAGQQKKPAAKKKSNTLLYVLLGVGGLVLVGGIGVVIVVMALILPAIRGARDAARRQVASQTGTTAVAQGDSWIVHTPAGGRFSVELPGKPTAKPLSQPTPFGIVKINMHTLGDADGAYFTAYNDYPAQMANTDPGEVLDSVCDRAIRGANAKLDSKQNINIDGHPGRAISFSGKAMGRPIEGHSRIYLVGLRLYQVMWVGNPDKVSQKNLDRFFASFKLTSTEVSPSESVDPSTAETESAPTTAPPPTPDNAANDDAETRYRKRIYRQIAQIQTDYELAMKTIEPLVKRGGGANLQKTTETLRKNALSFNAQNYRMSVEELEAILKEGKEKGWPK